MSNSEMWVVIGNRKQAPAPSTVLSRQEKCYRHNGYVRYPGNPWKRNNFSWDSSVFEALYNKCSHDEKNHKGRAVILWSNIDILDKIFIDILVMTIYQLNSVLSVFHVTKEKESRSICSIQNQVNWEQTIENWMKMNNIPIAIIYNISELFSHSLKNRHDIIFNFFVISFRCGKPDFSDYQQSFFITDPNIILDYFICSSQKSLTHGNTKTSIK